MLTVTRSRRKMRRQTTIFNTFERFGGKGGVGESEILIGQKIGAAFDGETPGGEIGVLRLLAVDETKRLRQTGAELGGVVGRGRLQPRVQ